MGGYPADWVKNLFSEHSSVLEAFLRRRTRGSQDVPDLCQEVYLRLMRVHDVDAVQDPEAYLFTIAYNLIKERGMRARRHGLAIEISSVFEDELIAETRSPEHDLDHAVRRQRLAAVLAELSPKCRAAVILQYRDGLTYAQIGAKLKVSSHMVKKYLAYAIAHCRRRMRSWG